MERWLKYSCYIKVLRVLQTTPNCLSNVSIGGIKRRASALCYVRQQGILVTYFGDLGRVIKIYKASYNTKII